jgi:hypothetical protein
MELNLDIENFESFTSDKILLKIKKGQWQEIYDGICHIQNKCIKMDFIFFKHFANKETYPLILSIITNKIDTLLLNENKFTVYVNMKSLTVAELEKHMDFIQHFSKLLRDKYPNKLLKCFIYNAPFVFSQLFQIISFFIDKETLSKVELITNK